ncbi:BnaA01g22470D [Brassica napus]|uniref:Uncharacterized protein n=2 Tax=Brassica TaxID=3705 RepID=M4ERR8_BRACM|nr:unnamed protein product [Brassica napus]CDY24543.1 BnaA01g22470D [Brassica napus]
MLVSVVRRDPTSGDLFTWFEGLSSRWSLERWRGEQKLIDMRQGSKRFDDCDLAVFILGDFRRLCIQGVWTEQRFPLSSYEVSGSWSYRLAGEAAAISMVWYRSGGYWVAGYRQQR